MCRYSDHTRYQLLPLPGEEAGTGAGSGPGGSGGGGGGWAAARSAWSRSSGNSESSSQVSFNTSIVLEKVPSEGS